jgi:hypothetical protein
MYMFLVILLALAIYPLTAKAQFQLLCPYAEVNPANNKQDITVSATAIVVLDANPNACSGFIRNTGAEEIRCAPATDGDPTATNGVSVASGDVLKLDFSARQQWKCIAPGADSTVTTAREKSQ